MTPSPIMLMVRTLGPGGTERQVTEIAKALDGRRFAPHVGCFEDDGFRAEELRAAGVPILCMRMSSFLSGDSPRAFMQMGAYFRRHGIRLVHTFDYPMNVFCAPAARLLGVPAVLSSQRSYRQLIPRKYIPALRITDRLVDGIVVNCEAIRKHLVVDFSVPTHKVEVCYNAIDVDTFHSGPRLRPPELDDASLVIGVTCVLRAIKDVATLVEAFSLINRVRPNLRLAIIGSGPERESLERQAFALGIREQCLFQPATKNVAPWLRAIDIFVLPSTTEALSNALMEAMASGCCAIASRIGGNPELVSENNTGLLFEPGDASDLAGKLACVVQDDALRARFAASAAARMTAEFSLDRCISRIERLYENKLENKRR